VYTNRRFAGPSSISSRRTCEKTTDVKDSRVQNRLRGRRGLSREFAKRYFMITTDRHCIFCLYKLHKFSERNAKSVLAACKFTKISRVIFVSHCQGGMSCVRLRVFFEVGFFNWSTKSCPNAFYFILINLIIIFDGFQRTLLGNNNFRLTSTITVFEIHIIIRCRPI